MNAIHQAVQALSTKNIDAAYIFDITSLELWAKTMRDTFRSILPHIEFYYSFKTNNLKKVTEILKLNGYGAEVTSLSELQMAIQDGYSFKSIVLDGPVKSAETIREALLRNIQIQVDNVYELDLIIAESKKAGINRKTINFTLRLKHDESRFGFNLEELILAKQICTGAGLTPIGFHIHFGSLILPEIYGSLFELLEMAKNAGFDLKSIDVLDLGGGLPSIEVDAIETLTRYATSIKSVVSVLGLKKSLRIQLEPGRSLIDRFGYLYGKVTAKKQRPHGGILFLNIGKNIVPTIGARKKSITHFSSNKQSDTFENIHEKYKIYGNQCFERDILLDEYSADRKIQVGDIFLFSHMGSYDFSTALLWNNSLPPVYGIYHNTLNILRDEVIPQTLRGTFQKEADLCI